MLEWKKGLFRIRIKTLHISENSLHCTALFQNYVRVRDGLAFVRLNLFGWICVKNGFAFAQLDLLDLWKIGLHLLLAHWSLYPDTHSAPMMTRYISLYQIPQIFQICQFIQMYPGICNHFSPFDDLTFEITSIDNKNVIKVISKGFGSQNLSVGISGQSLIFFSVLVDRTKSRDCFQISEFDPF